MFQDVGDCDDQWECKVAKNNATNDQLLTLMDEANYDTNAKTNDTKHLKELHPPMNCCKMF